MLGQVILLVVLIIFNGVFSASELAFLSVNKYKLKEEVKKGNKKAKKIEKLVNNPSKFLATIQIGITLAGFLASAFAAESFAEVIVSSVAFRGILKAVGYGVIKPIVVVLVTVVLSYFTLIFGELVPKRLALAYPDKIAYKTVGLIRIINKIFTPFVWILTKTTNVVSKLLGIDEHESEQITEEEIKKIIITGREEGAIESGEKKLIFNVFEFNDTPVKKAMTRKNKMVMVDIDSDKREILKIVKASKYTRIPVYKGEKDNVIGIINIKSLLLQYSKKSEIDLKEIMYSPTFVTPEEKLDDVFRMMQRSRQAIAVVKKGHEVVGLITLEDAIEEVLGNIYDEFDSKSDRERQSKNNQEDSK